ncbi:MAG TPA: phage holin family protein [Syntrophorhabdaceae bacterium]|nr:phage holin family protein [Syntrophorhabdaceae bacterium]HOT42402.1 phage holin family protein [Syntrophorhabdaceae bacterium]HPC65896.1 phage holin family protein [Syntrophorhabdaceae bacterium]HQE79683.1 phage holin family protein [Syntrophorhabdaceae bacterium]HQH43418.1 phage holin family protein [Syntrophorhabdaceae bacterium]
MIIIRWLLMALSIMILGYYLPGITINGFWSALWVALFLGIVNTIIKPVLVFITLPINILTLGLFTFVINASLVMLASSVIKGFQVQGFLYAVLFSVILSIINFLLNLLFKAR